MKFSKMRVVESKSGAFCVYDADGNRVALVQGSIAFPEHRKALAELFAAAPEMRGALAECYAALDLNERVRALLERLPK